MIPAGESAMNCNDVLLNACQSYCSFSKEQNLLSSLSQKYIDYVKSLERLPGKK